MWRVVGPLLGGTGLLLAASSSLFGEERGQPGLGDLLFAGYQYAVGTGMLLVGVGRMHRPASSRSWRRETVAAFRELPTPVESAKTERP